MSDSDTDASPAVSLDGTEDAHAGPTKLMASVRFANGAVRRYQPQR